jgi:hypothetical protein
MNKSDELLSNFQNVQKQFKEADTFEEKQSLLAVSQQIVREAMAALKSLSERSGDQIRQILFSCGSSAKTRRSRTPAQDSAPNCGTVRICLV